MVNTIRNGLIEEEAVDDDELFTNEELREVGVIAFDNEF